MKFRVLDRRICDYLDYFALGNELDLNQSCVVENNNNKYLLEKKEMSPKEYIIRCANMFEMSFDRLLESRDDDSLENLRNCINSKNYGIIYIDTFNKMQDGLHRAIVLMEKKVPKINVLVVTKI